MIVVKLTGWPRFHTGLRNGHGFWRLWALGQREVCTVHTNQNIQDTTDCVRLKHVLTCLKGHGRLQRMVTQRNEIVTKKIGEVKIK